jgi:hypothetical protein
MRIIFTLAVLGALFALIIKSEQDERERCEKAGFEYVRVGGRYACMKPGTVLKD